MSAPIARPTPTTPHAPAPTPTRTPAPSHAELADAVAAAVRAVPGVAGLHAGVFGEVGTYLPGRRVAGVSVGAGGAEIHVALLVGFPIRHTAALVRAAVAPLTGGPVHVTVEDVIADTDPGSTPDPVRAAAAHPGTPRLPDPPQNRATSSAPADSGAPGDRA